MFGRYMKRDCFKIITYYLHFSSDTSIGAAADKTWKVRPVLQTIEKAFRRGYGLGARISFDIGTIPNRSKCNPMSKAKPHNYGTKCYMRCCGETRYCLRVEIYLGKEYNSVMSKAVAQRAVIHDVTKALDGQPGKQLIIANIFYSSCALSLALLAKGHCYVGTHRSDRLGWPRAIPFTNKSRPKRMNISLGWLLLLGGLKTGEYDRDGLSDHPNYCLAMGQGRNRPSRCVVPAISCRISLRYGCRRLPRSAQIERYSVQQCVTFKKYFRLLFLVFVDMAIANGFILSKLVLQKKEI
ncbi:Hypothetical protein PHPALM_14472 [Phytophthora palmivora]|uniref:PiggyBac transposable element-derived protein domain-containing protein n=1 Tax=Phytophthora palmivora TaxID=4796 RepID=A0A2P4XUN0_9STRA|nr:Hypothetical protein PHPALM_14472 [Phytophthora palmivora]